jgi:hypothetical protein
MTDRWWWREVGWAGAGSPADPSPAATRSCVAKKVQALFFLKRKHAFQFHSRQKFFFFKFLHHTLL